MKILLEIFHLLRAYKPLTFFGILGLVSLCLYLITLAVVFGFAGVVLLCMGIMLHSFNYRIKELHCILTRADH